MKSNKKDNSKLNTGNKKKYRSPEIKPLGDIRDVTMGGSPGVGDSGGGVPEQPF